MNSQPISKRPTCPNCSKPIILCLCARLKTRNLDNKIHVTILQHSLEKKHPLNSARIAKLGLKNVDVFNVTDVNFEAKFDIWPLGLECTPSVCGNVSESLMFDGGFEGGTCWKRSFEQVGEVGLDGGSVLDSGSERISDGHCGSIGECQGSVLGSDSKQFSDGYLESIDEIAGFEGRVEISAEIDVPLLKQSDMDVVGQVERISNGCGNSVSNDSNTRNDEPLMSVTIGKSGKISSVSCKWKLLDVSKAPTIERFLDCPKVMKHLAKGFTIKKLQTRENNGSLELEQFEEFEIAVPPGSVVLFPGQTAVSVGAIDFQVKNLIVLDGTWSKAKRMYIENPWLKILPSVRLDVEKRSLFSEVRKQPKPGYLSTIESIVYALEALGKTENLSGLENLLDVLESMVEDQRRYKDHSLIKLSECEASNTQLEVPNSDTIRKHNTNPKQN